MAIRDPSWRDHLVHAAGLANMVTVAADHVADADTRAGLIAVAKAIDRHIEAGVDLVTAEIKAR
jgi:hypothetical protein